MHSYCILHFGPDQVIHADLMLLHAVMVLKLMFNVCGLQFLVAHRISHLAFKICKVPQYLVQNAKR